MGRPRKEIDADQVYRLASYGLTQDEIAEVFGCDQSVISRRFASEFHSARGSWKMSIRRAQTRRAVKDGSDQMLIHLGKSYLGQTDRIDMTSGNKPIAYVERAKNPRDLHAISSNGNGHTNGIPLEPPPETVGSD